MAEGRDDARIAEIRARHVLYDFGMVAPESGEWIASVSCRGCHRPWPCEPAELLARLGALEAERDHIAALREADHAWARLAVDNLRAERDALASRLAAAEAAMEAVIRCLICVGTGEDRRYYVADGYGAAFSAAIRAALAGSREQAATEGA